MFKFSEDIIIDELTEYIKTTYSSHYTNDENELQTLDVWKSRGSMSETCLDTSIKYLMRYGKKGGKNEMDLFKSIHYLILTISNERSSNGPIPYIKK
jgi:hypothetical protein